MNEEKIIVDDHLEDDTVYPPKKIVIPAMLAIALAFFLVALVLSSRSNAFRCHTHSSFRTERYSGQLHQQLQMNSTASAI